MQPPWGIPTGWKGRRGLGNPTDQLHVDADDGFPADFLRENENEIDIQYFTFFTIKDNPGRLTKSNFVFYDLGDGISSLLLWMIILYHLLSTRRWWPQIPNRWRPFAAKCARICRKIWKIWSMHTRQGFFLRIGVKNWRNFPLPSNTNKAGDAKEERDGLSGRSKVNEGIESCGFMQMNMGCWTWSWVFFPSMYS